MYGTKAPSTIRSNNNGNKIMIRTTVCYVLNLSFVQLQTHSIFFSQPVCPYDRLLSLYHVQFYLGNCFTSFCFISKRVNKYSFTLASFCSLHRHYDIVVFNICHCSLYCASSFAWKFRAHLHINTLVSMTLPVKFYLNFLSKKKWASIGNSIQHRQYWNCWQRQSEMANEQWWGWINWIITSSIGKVNSKQKLIESNDYNGHFECYIIFHCTFSGPLFNSIVVSMYVRQCTPIWLRIGRSLCSLFFLFT